ncbi:hypothetical protein JTE90_019354 [Oedothorax gibbosus]|uniref:Uncharacterized protein n=1 Tax=Oedothorax gibbosus TaxID=931172 RepID=A0AAV6ULU9_9ARAC|nr:hypothetical protein JTE90_019354 [Oedothorax gibbosus]
MCIIHKLEEKRDMESHIRIAVFLLVIVVLDLAVALQVQSLKESQGEIAREGKCGKDGDRCHSAQATFANTEFSASD